MPMKSAASVAYIKQTGIISGLTRVKVKFTNTKKKKTTTKQRFTFNNLISDNETCYVGSLYAEDRIA